MGFVPPLQITISHFSKQIGCEQKWMSYLTDVLVLTADTSILFPQNPSFGPQKNMKLLSPCKPLPRFFQNTNNNNDITTCFVIYPIVDCALGLFFTGYQCLYPPYVNSTDPHPMLIGGSGHTSSCL